VYGIVKNHKGHIEIFSKPAKGTTVSVLLPASEKRIDEDDTEFEIIPGEGSILVVDDEEEVLNVIKDQLTSIGYTVFLAEDGIKALEIYRQYKRQINIVLLDMIMPKVTGKETFFALRKLNPDLKVILISGFSKSDEAIELMEKGAEDFIQKPISLPELSQRISQILNKSI